MYADFTRRFLHQEIPRWRTYTGSVYNFVTENITTNITEIASISVFVSKLLVLPVWGTVSIFSLYLMVVSTVGLCVVCRRKWKWIGRARELSKPLRSRWNKSRCPVFTTSGFGGFLLPVCMPSSEVTTRVIGLTCIRKHGYIAVRFFHLQHA